jgi:hypothetical protein
MYGILQDASFVSRALKDKTQDAFLDFADWAFSADGLPKLQVVAYGYRQLTQGNVSAWDLQKNMDMLAAFTMPKQNAG